MTATAEAGGPRARPPAAGAPPLLEPVSVTKDNISKYTGEPDFPKVEEICAGNLASKCKEIGLQ